MTFGLTLTRRGRRVLRLVPVLLALLALLGAGWLWLRDSGLVRVRSVDVIGVTASDGPEVRAALEDAARGMTTLHVRERALRDAVARYSSVAAVSAEAHFPHRLTIHVTEQRAVAALAPDQGGRIPVTRSGIVLRGIAPDRDLPSVYLATTAVGPQLRDRKLLGALAIAGAAPEPLLHRSNEVTLDERGVIVTLRDGPDLVFGDGADARAKW